jgi:hypothetical protein
MLSYNPADSFYKYAINTKQVIKEWGLTVITVIFYFSLKGLPECKVN